MTVRNEKEMEDSDVLKLSMSIPFPSAREAEIAYDVLSVDQEPRRSAVSKELAVEKNILKVNFSAEEARMLRVAVHSFLDYVILVTQTMEQFGPPRSEKYCPKSTAE